MKVVRPDFYMDPKQWVYYVTPDDGATFYPDPTETGYYLITTRDRITNGICMDVAFFQSYGECYGWDRCPSDVRAWYPVVLPRPFDILEYFGMAGSKDANDRTGFDEGKR